MGRPGLEWELPSGVILFFLIIALGSEVQDTVYVAYPTNFVSLTNNGDRTFYRTPVTRAAERNFFKQVDGLDCDRNKEMICWTDLHYNAVRCSKPLPENLCSDKKVHFRVNNIVIKTSGKPKDVALDPCHMMLYWTDPVRHAIGVARIKRDDLGKIIPITSAEILTAVAPTSIAVDSCNGYIFFTDVGEGAEKVARARTDGSSIQTLTLTSPSNQKLRYPTALALDRPNKIIFFGDTGLGEIFKMTYDGKNLETVSKANNIYDMALGCSYQRILYTSNASSGNPMYVLFNRPHSYTLHLHHIGSRDYLGACSYCNNCHCETNCSKNGDCSHLCFEKSGNSTSGLKCGCPDGYTLGPNNRCIVESGQLLVANRSSVFSIKPNRTGGMDGTPTELSLGYLSTLYGLDYVEQGGHQYVVLTDGNSVKRFNFDGSGGVTIVGGLSGVRGVAADCFTGNIYYCQMRKDVISVTNLKGTMQCDCHTKLEQPFEVVLNTKKGTLFYTSIRSKSIFTASMDCTGNSTLIVVDVKGVPAGLALNGSSQTLYWTNYAERRIESYNLSTKRRAVIAQANSLYLHRPVGLTLLDNYLYFTDWGSHCVGSVSTQSSPVAGVHCISGSRMHGITHVVEQCYDQQIENCCIQCSDLQMCLLSSENGGGGSCKCCCPPGFISDGGEPCRLRDKNFILVSVRHAIVALSLNGAEDWITQLPLPRGNIIALDLDKTGGTVFWTDASTMKIMCANLDGTARRPVLVHDPSRNVCRLCMPEGLVYDSYNKTERLYYTDAAAGEICFIDLASANDPVRLLGGLDKPRAIAINQKSPRKLYFTQRGENPTISSVVVENLTTEVVIDKNLTLPNALAVSSDGNGLYFGDATEDYIAYYNLNSRKVSYIKNATPVQVYDMVEYQDGTSQLLWSDWTEGVVKMASGTEVTLASSEYVHLPLGITVHKRNDEGNT